MFGASQFGFTGGGSRPVSRTLRARVPTPPAASATLWR